MPYRRLPLAPESQVETERRGAVRGRFCKVCGAIYPRFAARHSGKPMYGKDHVASPCTQEGDAFDDGESWWEPAVEVTPAGSSDDGDEGGSPSDTPSG
ncbi:MAG: hypothetical protein R3244_05715 [Thermoanaerobaculia bacterium]|nr:hypothetical protein [Thermoanaerobaculia bacterium]